MPETHRNTPDGTVWFTIAQAARFTGRSKFTIYSWERRGILKDHREDEYGHRVYSQMQIAKAERAVRAQAAPRLASART